MATLTGAQASFNREVGVKLDIDEAISILPIDDVPLQARLSQEGTRSIKVEWLEEDLTPSTATVVSTAELTSPWKVVLSDASGVRLGDVYQLVDAAYDVQYHVTALDPDGDNENEVTVASFGGADDTNDPAADDVWQLIGQYRTEGADPEDARFVDRTMPYNYTQWGQEEVKVTRTQQKRAMYGLTDPYGHEVMKKFKELAIRTEKSMVYGVRTFAGDATKRFMGGLLYYVTDNSRSGNAAAVKASINSLARDIWADGGDPSRCTLFVSPAVKVAISANVDPTLRRVERSDATGGYVVERVLTDFGEIPIVVDRHFPTTKGILLDTSFTKRRPFDRYFHETLAKTGDSESGHIVGEQSLEVKNEKASGVLTVTDAA
jgi:hypothetical protein